MIRLYLYIQTTASIPTPRTGSFSKIPDPRWFCLDLLTQVVIIFCLLDPHCPRTGKKMTQDKPYTLTLIRRNLYVYAHIKADVVSRELIAQYMAEVLEECRAAGKKRLMIYRDIPEMLSPDDIKVAGAEFAKMIADIRTAGVNPYLSHIEVANAFKHMSEHTNFRLFKSFNEAEAWLLLDE